MPTTRKAETRPLRPLPPSEPPDSGPTLVRRLLTRRSAVLFWRNTLVSTGVFLLGLVLLWLMVERFGAAKVPAAALSFMISNTIHYAFGRTWIYRGTERAVASGYAYFLVNAVVGLAITVALFAGFVELGLHYLLARVVASIFAGLALFVLNAVFNFKSL